mmetsp:Transcript_38209/g.56090  ORF Transcript_38209/g.56090 Transcript_38209/m.56090 type:complete len:489 (-) Transcript_38209:312-1778(-)
MEEGPLFDISKRDKFSINFPGYDIPRDRLSIAPMMDVTDRHFRFMMRLLTRRTMLWTEMVVDDTLLHNGDILGYYLGFDPIENPITVQLGGNHPEKLAEAAGICEQFGGYDEINLNCGCPSPKVSSRCFGAALMLDPERVREITHQMARRATSTPITVKCRIGADDKDSYEDLVNFVSTVKQSGVNHFIVHARKCILNGLSAAKNRTVPPLKYDVVQRLAADFPELKFSINGGITDFDQARARLAAGPANLRGAMLGRAAWHTPWLFRTADSEFYGRRDPGYTRREVVQKHLEYCRKLEDTYGNIKDSDTGQYGWGKFMMVRPLMHLFGGTPGSRNFKRALTECWNHNKETVELEDLVLDQLHHIPERYLDEPPVPPEAGRCSSSDDNCCNNTPPTLGTSEQEEDCSCYFGNDHGVGGAENGGTMDPSSSTINEEDINSDKNSRANINDRRHYDINSAPPPLPPSSLFPPDTSPSEVIGTPPSLYTVG